MEDKRCKRCIMPATYPGITFNDEGICNYCTGSRPVTSENKADLIGEDKLIKLIRGEKNKGEYDCVVPLSGGKDSTYALYYAVKKLGLKPLAVTYSSGFQTQMAMDNIQNACEILNVPCVIEKANQKNQDKLLKDSLRISDVIGSFVLTCLSCGTLIKAIPTKVAKQRKIPYILFGDSIRESVRLIKLKSKIENADYKKVRDNNFIVGIVERFAKLKEVRMTPFKFLHILPRLIRYRVLTMYQLLSLGVPLKQAVFPNIGIELRENDPQMIHFFDYIDWDPVEGINVLTKELKWKHPPDRKSRFDCCLNCFGSYDALRKGGISGNGIIACNLIREGLLSREEALKVEQICMDTVEQQCRDVINKLGLSNIVIRDLDKGQQKNQ